VELEAVVHPRLWAYNRRFLLLQQRLIFCRFGTWLLVVARCRRIRPVRRLCLCSLRHRGVSLVEYAASDWLIMVYYALNPQISSETGANLDSH